MGKSARLPIGQSNASPERHYSQKNGGRQEVQLLRPRPGQTSAERPRTLARRATVSTSCHPPLPRGDCDNATRFIGWNAYGSH
eukprot:UN3587